MSAMTGPYVAFSVGGGLDFATSGTFYLTIMTNKLNLIIYVPNIGPLTMTDLVARGVCLNPSWIPACCEGPATTSNFLCDVHQMNITNSFDKPTHFQSVFVKHP